MSYTKKLAALVAISAFALAGCSSQDADDRSETAAGEVSETPAAEPVEEPAEEPSAATEEDPAPEEASGDRLSGSDYDFAVPDGWGEAGAAPGFDSDVLIADLDDQDGFADNMNVILVPLDADYSVTQVEESSVGELEAVGATGITVQDRVSIDGLEAAHISAELTVGEASYVTEQFLLVKDATSHVITFSFSPTVGEGDRAALTDAVLASWAWQ